MKQFALPFLTLMIGLILGSWGPRSDLRIARTEISGLKTELREKSSRPLVTDVTKMLGVTSGRQAAPVADSPEPAPAHIPDPVSIQPGLPGDDLDETFEEIGTPSPQNISEAIEAAQDLWKIRSAQSRELLIESLNLTESEVERFDEITSEMNNKLRDEIARTVEELKSRETLTSEDGLKMVNHISGILINAYDQTDTYFPPGWRDDMNEDTDLLNFIDPSVAVPLLDLENIPDGEQP